MNFLRYTALFLFVLVLGAFAIALNRSLIPDHNTTATHFDTLLVLGSSANLDGTPSPDQRVRVLEAVREYKAGIAPNIIMTGGPAHNRFVEAHVMASLAEAQGVPSSAVYEEPKAQNTIQNIFYSSEIMHARNWRSAEIISSSAHLGRSAMIMQATVKAHPDLAIDWRNHAAPWPVEKSQLYRLALEALEATRCLQIRLFGFPHSPFLP